MLIDYVLGVDSRSRNDYYCELSYTNEVGMIDVERVYFDGGFPAFVECDEYDPDRLDITSYLGKPLKYELRSTVSNFNAHHLLDHVIRQKNPDLYDRYSKLNIPRVFSIDIETEINNENGYSSPDKAENRILSISITSDNFNTLCLVVDDKKYEKLTISDRAYIDSILEDSLGDFYNQRSYDYQIKAFDNEYDMLNTFVSHINRYFHVTIGWNVLDYDWTYIQNRCKRLGINFYKSSPTGEKCPPKNSINIGLMTSVDTARHRLFVDYMNLFKSSYVYKNLSGFSLNAISEEILGLSKVSYSGNLRTLYESDRLKFYAYALVDTILVMLLHHTTALFNINVFQAYYNGIPYMKLNQNPVSEKLIYRYLIARNKVFIESEFSTQDVRPYPGGFVKQPTKLTSNSTMGLDFNSLYPNSMITSMLSFETKSDISIEVGEDGRPVNESEMSRWLGYRDQGYSLAPTGRLYRRVDDAIITEIEKSLLAERSEFKKIYMDIYLKYIPLIEKSLKS